MERRTVTRTLRALRRRKKLSQRRVGSQLGISQPEISRRERGALETCTVVDVERWASVLGAHLALDLTVNGQRPLADARHAAIQVWLVAVLRRAGWLAEPEVSFNHFGDRGRVDVLAFHPAAQASVVVEIKTSLDDVQDVLGRLDVKRRIGVKLVASRGWSRSPPIPVLLFLASTTVRRRISDHSALFAGYPLRGRAAMAWLRKPRQPAPTGILALVRDPTTRAR